MRCAEPVGRGLPPGVDDEVAVGVDVDVVAVGVVLVLPRRSTPSPGLQAPVPQRLGHVGEVALPQQLRLGRPRNGLRFRFGLRFGNDHVAVDAGAHSLPPGLDEARHRNGQEVGTQPGIANSQGVEHVDDHRADRDPGGGCGGDRHRGLGRCGLGRRVCRDALRLRCSGRGLDRSRRAVDRVPQFLAVIGLLARDRDRHAHPAGLVGAGVVPLRGSRCDRFFSASVSRARVVPARGGSLVGALSPACVVLAADAVLAREVNGFDGVDRVSVSVRRVIVRVLRDLLGQVIGLGDGVEIVDLVVGRSVGRVVGRSVGGVAIRCIRRGGPVGRTAFLRRGAILRGRAGGCAGVSRSGPSGRGGSGQHGRTKSGNEHTAGQPVFAVDARRAITVVTSHDSIHPCCRRQETETNTARPSHRCRATANARIQMRTPPRKRISVNGPGEGSLEETLRKLTSLHSKRYPIA